MDFSLTPAEEAFRQEIREFLEREALPEWRGGVYAGPAYKEGEAEEERAFRKKLAAHGWLGLALPKEYGGQGRSVREQLLFGEEMTYFGAPHAHAATGYVAPALLLFGSDFLKKEFVTAIARGDIDFALGYTEPDGGSDLAALKTRADRDGDDFIINGQKMFTSIAHTAEYCWLAVRTDQDAPKHKGISLFIVDLKSPGITVRPLITIADNRTNAVYYDNVRVSNKYLVGELNRGWYHIGTALDFDRLNIPIGNARWILEKLTQYVSEMSFGDVSLKSVPWIRQGIAEMWARVQAAESIQLWNASIVEQGGVPNAGASMQKVLISELQRDIALLGTRVLGLYGTIEEGSPWAQLGGRIERAARGTLMLTFAGGSNEIQRNIIATRGLGLPR